MTAPLKEGAVVELAIQKVYKTTQRTPNISPPKLLPLLGEVAIQQLLCFLKKAK
jgi:hypothetical protein